MRTQIKRKSTELQDRAANTFNYLVKKSHFNHHKIMAEKRENTETITSLASSKLETAEQLFSEQLLDNDSLGG